MPIEQCSNSPHVAFVLTKHGSHCGHMKGLWPWKQSWLDALCMQFFKAILDPNNAGDASGLSGAGMAKSQASGGLQKQSSCKLDRHSFPPARAMSGNVEVHCLPMTRKLRSSHKESKGKTN